jgi:hypothetical protein
MGHNLATWKTLEEIMIELRRKDVIVSEKIVEDLRSAKSMIRLSCMPDSGDAIMKAEELMANVEAYLVNEGQKVFDSAYVDGWLRRLEEASVCGKLCSEPVQEETFVTGVPRDQKWIRIEPIGNLSVEQIQQDAMIFNLQVSAQNDGKLLVYGKSSDLKEFLKKITADNRIARR